MRRQWYYHQHYVTACKMYYLLAIIQEVNLYFFKWANPGLFYFSPFQYSYQEKRSI